MNPVVQVKWSPYLKLPFLATFHAWIMSDSESPQNFMPRGPDTEPILAKVHSCICLAWVTVWHYLYQTHSSHLLLHMHCHQPLVCFLCCLWFIVDLFIFFFIAIYCTATPKSRHSHNICTCLYMHGILPLVFSALVERRNMVCKWFWVIYHIWKVTFHL